MSSETQIYSIPLEERLECIRFLNLCLPTCVALYRRIQFGHFTPTSRLLSSVRPEDLKDGNESDRPWIAAFADRTCRPETEVWITASWEHDGSELDGNWTSHNEALVTNLVQEIKKLGIPEDDAAGIERSKDAKDSSQTTNGSTAVDRGQYEGHMSNTGIVLFGAVHESTVKILRKLDLLAPGFVGADIPYQKYIFDLAKTSNMPHRALPSNLVYGKVDPMHYWLIKSRTEIPRQDRTLCKLPSLAIYPSHDQSTTPAPVAWAFLGLDASLTTLHVEPEYRGLGLAKSLSMKLFADDMKIYWQCVPSELVDSSRCSHDRYGHADVATDNDASSGVCKGLGGVSHFLLYWLRVDVDKA